jgi:hypothetical protein
MTKNIIPSDKAQEKRMGNPGKNNEFVGSRQGGPLEHSRTKMESNKHHNPEFFKRQSDKKNMDNIPARKDIPIQNNVNHRQKNVGNDPGRGVGCVGRDRSNFQEKQFSKGRILAQ